MAPKPNVSFEPRNRSPELQTAKKTSGWMALVGLSLAAWPQSVRAAGNTFEPSSPEVHLRAHLDARGELRGSRGARSVRVAPSLWFEEARDEGVAEGVGFPRRLLLDRATGAMNLGAARALPDAAGSGFGVVIGIVDGGIDAAHPDLRHADGSSRMAWWIDFGQTPYGLHTELESEYGCTGTTTRCGILARAELDELLRGAELSTADRVVALPTDSLGHGTLVASLALGNGRSDERYAGVAPEATLIGARVATAAGQVSDLDVLLATRFVFERADEMNMPAVVNLSLGGDMGPHDGSSTLEMALAQWVEGSKGRAIVVAAGNSGTLTAASPPYPAPFGIHTDVHVPKGSVVRVPLLFPPTASDRAVVYVWLSTGTADRLRVGLEEGDGTAVLPFVARGERLSATNGDVQATLVHHAESALGIDDTERGIALVLSGAVDASSVFSLLLEGEATVELWVQSEGDLAPEAGRGRVLFPSATRERTVTLPATSPDVIAVGATLNRTTWRSFGDSVHLTGFDPELSFSVGSVVPFSSVGPNALGLVKPDLVAPGGVVIGALASGAEAALDGQINWQSIFGPTPLCSSFACAQVDDRYGVSIGTSMAAPLVSGAAALLFEKNPRLSHSTLRRLLQAGARRGLTDDPRSGAGLLDVEGAFAALALEGSEKGACRSASGEESWLSFAQSFVQPGADVPLVALLHLRDAAGKLCDVDPASLRVSVSNGEAITPLLRDAAGLYRMNLVAARGTAGERLVVRVGQIAGAAIRGDVPIALDSSVNAHGVSVRGGCASWAPAAAFSEPGWLYIAMTFVGLTLARIVSPRLRGGWTRHASHRDCRESAQAVCQAESHRGRRSGRPRI